MEQAQLKYKVNVFADLLEKEQAAVLQQKYPNTEPETVSVVFGRKYTKVDVGNSGKYMVVNSTGEIFGIKGYGVIHRGHPYGTLDTIQDWDWGGYTATPKTD